MRFGGPCEQGVRVDRNDVVDVIDVGDAAGVVGAIDFVDSLDAVDVTDVVDHVDSDYAVTVWMPVVCINIIGEVNPVIAVNLVPNGNNHA